MRNYDKQHRTRSSYKVLLDGVKRVSGGKLKTF